MNRDEKYLAHIQFQLEIYKRNGQNFEDLFTRIMTLHNPKFTPIKPYGSIGDRKNDGYDKEQGVYYQVYGPEDLSKQKGDAVAKLKGDFEGLIEHWNTISPIKEFYFVLNDKYKGSLPQIEELLSGLETTHSIKCSSFLSKDLENIFSLLNEDDKLKVIGNIPNPLQITSIEYGYLKDVITHLMSLKPKKLTETIPINPNFLQKIEINQLSEIAATFLKLGSYQLGEIENYFKTKSDFNKNDLRQRFVELYDEGCNLIGNNNNSNDNVFFYIMEKAMPKEEVVYQSPVAALMAYYFEYCDIFKAPE